MMLQSFSFNQEFDDRIWGLFAQGGCLDSDYNLAIIKGAMAGKIDLNKPFYMNAYIKRCKELDALEASRRAKKNIKIDNDMYESSGYGVTEDMLSEYIEQPDEYQKVEDAIDLEYSVKYINKIASTIFAIHKINIKSALVEARDGNKKSLRKIKKICSSDEVIAECIQILLTSGKSLEEIFGEDVEK